MRRTLLLAGLFLTTAASPYDIPLRHTATAPTASGAARLVFGASPFGVTVTADGVASYDIRFELTGLPEPEALGEYTAYVAWVVTTDLGRWQRLGTVRNGVTTLGRAEFNKFLVVITAEADPTAASRSGPTILHGPSPSTWLQSMLSHPLFRGIPPA